MNSNHTDIVAYIESMYASRHHIAQAYCEGSVDIDPKYQQPLRQLQQLRMMQPGMKADSLRLSSPMNKLFDHALQRSRSLAISSNFAEQISRLSDMVEGFFNALSEGQIDDQENYLNDFDLAAYDISEEVEYMLVHVGTMAHNNFANASSYAEKVRQNDHYLKQMKKLVQTLSDLQDQGMIDLLDSSLETKFLSQLYYHHIVGRLSNWRSMLLDIISHLERYLYKLRAVEPNAQRIRSFSMFLHQHPEYTPRDIDDYPTMPEWAYLHEGLKLVAYPDLENEDDLPELALLAKNIVSTVKATPKKRESGVLTLDTEELTEELNPTPFENMVFDYFQEARSTAKPCSAVEFFRTSKHLETDNISLALMCFASMLDVPARAREMQVNDFDVIPTIEELPGQFSGNLNVVDFVTCLRP